MSEILVTTTDEIPGYDLEVIGVVFGNTVRAKHIGKDIFAGLKSLIGGEIGAYTEMLSEARAEALSRMVAEARSMGADAVVASRFTTAETMPGAAEIVAFGTAVKMKKK